MRAVGNGLGPPIGGDASAACWARVALGTCAGKANPSTSGPKALCWCGMNTGSPPPLAAAGIFDLFHFGHARALEQAKLRWGGAAAQFHNAVAASPLCSSCMAAPVADMRLWSAHRCRPWFHLPQLPAAPTPPTVMPACSFPNAYLLDRPRPSPNDCLPCLPACLPAASPMPTCWWVCAMTRTH